MDSKLYDQFGDNWDNKSYRDYILARLNPTMDILDLGAGRGYVEEMNFRGMARSVSGVDPDPAVLENIFLDEAKEILSDSRIPYPKESFDLVFTNNVLEHIKDPASFFSEVYRTLKSGGLFLSKTTNKFHYVTFIARITPHRFHEFINEKRGRKAIDTYPTYYRCNSIEEITMYTEQSGLTVIDVQQWEGRPEYLRFSALTYYLGYIYEQFVNNYKSLSKYRCVIVFSLKK